MANYDENDEQKKKKKECKDKTVIFRMTESDEELLQFLSYHMDESRSEVVRRAIKVYYHAMKDQLG